MRLHLLLLLATVSAAYGYHILCVFPIPSHSHNQLGKAIVDPLLKNGHEVTWVTPYPEKVGKNPPKNLHVLGVSEVTRFVEKPVDLSETVSKSMSSGLAYVKQFSNNITMTVLANSAVREVLLKSQFDAVVTETFFSDVLAGLPAVLQAPWILLAGTQLMSHLEEQVDEVRSVSTVPFIFNPDGIPMSFKGRALNAFMYTFMSVMNWWDRPSTAALYEDLFAPLAAARNVPLPPFEDAFYNVSILFLNAHESLSPAFATPPNVINIAGYHIDENPPPLPKDLQELLDNSKQGVIYFSMGSVLRSAAFPVSTRKALLAKFAKLPYTVIWKFEEKMDEELPPNVHVRPWIPQLSLLSHPNIKVFITHGGQLSALEAVRSGVPMLAIPVIGDQPANAERARAAGYALKVTYNVDMADEVEEKLKELLNNPSYKEKVQYLSKLFRARPVHPSKLVTHYIELAIETKGAYHLRSLSKQYSTIERWMLDVVAVFLAALILIVLIFILAIKKCWRIICGKTTSPAVNKKSIKKKRN